MQPEIAGLRERLREARLGSGLSLEKYAEAVGLTRQAIQAWETPGNNYPEMRRLLVISELSGRPLAWFFQADAPAPDLMARHLAQVTQRMEELTRAHAELAAQVARLAPTPVPQFALVGGSSLAAEAPPPAQHRTEPVSLPDGFFAALLGGGAIPTKSQAERMGALLRAAAKRLGLGPKGLAERLRVPVADVERVFAGKPCGGGWGVAEVAAGLGLAIEGDQVEWRLPEGHRLSKREAGFWQGQRELGKLMEGI